MVNTSINPFVGRIAASCARSLLAYHCGMSRRSLVGLLATRLSPQAGKSLVMRGSLRFTPKRVKQAIRAADARKNEFLEASNGGC